MCGLNELDIVTNSAKHFHTKLFEGEREGKSFSPKKFPLAHKTQNMEDLL
jgi:hypothetical protein